MVLHNYLTTRTLVRMRPNHNMCRKAEYIELSKSGVSFKVKVELVVVIEVVVYDPLLSICK